MGLKTVQQTATQTKKKRRKRGLNRLGNSKQTSFISINRRFLNHSHKYEHFDSISHDEKLQFILQDEQRRSQVERLKHFLTPTTLFHGEGKKPAFTTQRGRWRRQRGGSLPGGDQVFFCPMKRAIKAGSQAQSPSSSPGAVGCVCVCVCGATVFFSWRKAAELRLMSPGQGGASPGHMMSLRWFK